MRTPPRRMRGFGIAVLVVILTTGAAMSGRSIDPRQTSAIAPGTRVVLDAHNAYPYGGKFADRIERALSGGVPVAIEQDLIWRPAADGQPGRSVVSHGPPFDGQEPSLEAYFFERVRPIVEAALRSGDASDWPLVTLNLDLKSNEPEHHQALWALLGRYEAWLTTAVRTPDGTRPAPLTVKPILVLTGSSDAQEVSFHDQVPVGQRLRLFGAVNVQPSQPLPAATNYRRWWNANWSVVETGGQRQAGEWTDADETKLNTLVSEAHAAGLWVRFWTLNGSDEATRIANEWSASYNFGSREAAEIRWRAAIAAGADYVATDHYEQFSEVLHQIRPPRKQSHEVILEGTITPADRLRWLERTFEVPRDIERLEVETSYSDRENGTAIEFGLYDPDRFRGASRTSKTAFFVERDRATASYTPGPIQAGRWRLLMGIPSIRDGVASHYRVVVRLIPHGAPGTPLAQTIDGAAAGPRWYQGDLHAHTMHSDGFGCLNGDDTPGPCAISDVVAAASRRKLDFVALTDHNTTSHHAGLVEAQARYPGLLLLRGQEVTTFFGHANVYGTSEVVDFRLEANGRSIGDVLDQVDALRALLSINHPGRDTGERCTGCGWSAPGTDYNRVAAMEVVNGSVLTGPTAGIPVWERRLNEGARMTAIGGGDDHGASTGPRSAVGTPTTVVYATTLTEAAILAGIRAGHVFIKTRGPEGPDLRFTAPDVGALMGDAVTVAAGQVRFRVAAHAADGQHVDFIRNGQLETSTLLDGSDAVDLRLSIRPGDWVRVNLRDSQGVTALSNPIYFQ